MQGRKATYSEYSEYIAAGSSVHFEPPCSWQRAGFAALRYHAANAIVALGASKALGKTMAQRFVVPSVVRQVGRKRPAKMMACLEGSSVDAFERKELFRCVLELSAILGVEALDYVLDTLYQTVERLCQYYPPPKSGPSSPSASSKDGEIAPSTISRDALAMQEVFTVFSGLLQRLHQNTVIRKFFCRSGLTFPKILGALPEPADVDLHLGYVEALVFCCQVCKIAGFLHWICKWPQLRLPWLKVHV